MSCLDARTLDLAASRLKYLRPTAWLLIRLDDQAVMLDAAKLRCELAAAAQMPPDNLTVTVAPGVVTIEHFPFSMRPACFGGGRGAPFFAVRRWEDSLPDD